MGHLKTTSIALIFLALACLASLATDASAAELTQTQQMQTTLFKHMRFGLYQITISDYSPQSQTAKVVVTDYQGNTICSHSDYQSAKCLLKVGGHANTYGNTQISLISYDANRKTFNLLVKSPSPNTLTYDVVVIGSTPQAIAAAVASAKNGARTLLLADTFNLGGLWTRSWVIPVDVTPKTVLVGGQTKRYLAQRGLFETFLSGISTGNLLQVGIDAKTAQDYFTHLALSTENLDLLRHYRVTGFKTAGNARTVQQVTAIKYGKTITIQANEFIDATDNGDLVFKLGVPYSIGRSSVISGDTQAQATALAFKINNVNWNLLPHNPQEVIGAGNGNTVTTSSASGILLIPAKVNQQYTGNDNCFDMGNANVAPQKDGSLIVENALRLYCLKHTNPLSDYLSVKQRTNQLANDYLSYLKTSSPYKAAFSKSTVVVLAPSLYVREYRHYIGIRTLNDHMVQCGYAGSDSVAVGTYFSDIYVATKVEDLTHLDPRLLSMLTQDASTCSTNSGSNYLSQNTLYGTHAYGIPFGTMVPVNYDNVIMVGNGISADSLAYGSARVLSQIVDLGQAAGTAGAIASKGKNTMPQIENNANLIKQLVNAITSQGGVVNPGSP